MSGEVRPTVSGRFRLRRVRVLSLRDRPRCQEPIGGTLVSPAPVGVELDTLGNVHLVTLTLQGERLRRTAEWTGGRHPVRNPDRAASRPVTRMFRRPAVVAAMTVVTLLSGAGTASAVQAEPNAMTFGLLGPVGLVAVVLGVLGMAAGVIRQRKKNRTQTATSTVETGAPVGTITVPDTEAGVAVSSRAAD